MEDIRACAGTAGRAEDPIKDGDRPGRYTQGAGNGSLWGDNCQTDARRILSKCCLQAPDWIPDLYAYPFKEIFRSLLRDLIF